MIIWNIRARKRYISIILLFLAVCLYGVIHYYLNSEKRHIDALSWAVANKMIVLDPGHGGTDPGVLGTTGIHEKEIVLSVSKMLADILDDAGMETVLTRVNDDELSAPAAGAEYDGYDQDLSRRVALANNNQAEIFVSIHVNSFTNSREGGAQTFYQPGSAKGKELAEAIQKELNRYLVNPGRMAEAEDYFITRMTDMPSVIVEIGFITNPKEEKLLLDKDYQKKVAWAIHAGIVNYFVNDLQK